MAWAVEVYGEEADGQYVPVVEDEALALLDDPAARLDAAKQVGWLQAVASGKVSAYYEPELSVDGWACQYRTEGEVVIIFSRTGPERLLVLRFGRATNTFPTGADLTLAGQRMQLWSRRNVG